MSAHPVDQLIVRLIREGVEASPEDVDRIVQRVVEEEQWIFGTTAAEYLADLSAATLHPDARILVYERAKDTVAATITPTLDVVPDHRRGRRALPHLLVVYSARDSVVRTGYMYSDLSELDMPEAILWLR